jgi:hypothetical protein
VAAPPGLGGDRPGGGFPRPDEGLVPGQHAVTGPERLAQLWRLRRFRAQNPGAIVSRDTTFGFWQAWVPVSNGGTVITRYQLQELLDALEELPGPARTRAAVQASTLMLETGPVDPLGTPGD